MRNTSRRTKLIGGALLAAAVAATSIATVTPVSADIGDAPYTVSYIRVQPAPAPNGTWEDQPVPSIQQGATSAAASSVQILIPTNWESGDIITLQVQADGAPHATNCLSAAQSISFAGPYGAADVVAANIPYQDANGWGALDGGDTLAYAPTNGPANNPDPKTPDPTPSVKPTFTVALTTSPSCVGVGVTDQIQLTFSNTATVVDGGQYEITFSNIKYNVGAAVTPGPVHVIPFARQAVDGAPGTYLSIPTFGANMPSGGNIYAPQFAPFWTDNAYVAPVTLEATGTNIVADGFNQPLGTITLTEKAVDALGSGNHLICLDVAGSPAITISNPVTAAGTGLNVGGNVTAVAAANCITITINNANNAAIGTVTLSGLVANTMTAGTISVSLVSGAGNWQSYLNPDDQDDGESGVYSDVNVGTYPKAAFGVVVAVPQRIGGADRYETSAKIAANVTSCTEWAVVVSGASYPDALSANFLAGALAANTPDDVPVLLVGTDSVPAAVSAYISAAGVKNVYIVGGTSAVSAAVESALKATPATKCTGASAVNSTNPVPNQKLLVVRVAGANRYATNRAAVNLGSDIFPMNSNMRQLEFLTAAKHTAIVATGTAFADALAAGPAVYDGLPLILTSGESLSPEAALALTDNDITQVIIVGGTSAVSDAVKAQIVALGIHAERISGADRYATATAFADFLAKGAPVAAVAGAFDGGLNWGPAGRVLLASGTNFADALSAGPLSYVSGAPIILTEPTVLSANSQTWLVAHKAAIAYVTALGLGSAISTSVLNAANTAIS